MLITESEAEKILQVAIANEENIEVAGVYQGLHKGETNHTVQIDGVRAVLSRKKDSKVDGI